MGSRKKASQIEEKQEIPELQGTFLKPEEYWEWRCAISDMQTAKTELKLAESQLIALRKDMEISALKTKLFELNQIENAKAKVDQSVKAYDENKKRLEQVHQISLSGKIIDEVTYEIKELQE